MTQDDVKMTSLELKRQLELIRADKSLTTRQKILAKRDIWAKYESDMNCAKHSLAEN